MLPKVDLDTDLESSRRQIATECTVVMIHSNRKRMQSHCSNSDGRSRIVVIIMSLRKKA
jgi:hypothetical protein